MSPVQSFYRTVTSVSCTETFQDAIFKSTFPTLKNEKADRDCAYLTAHVDRDRSVEYIRINLS